MHSLYLIALYLIAHSRFEYLHAFENFKLKNYTLKKIPIKVPIFNAKIVSLTH